MQTLIKSREIDIDTDFKEVIFKKTSKIEKHLPDAHSLEVEIFPLSKRSNSSPTSVELTLSVKGTLMRAESNHSDVLSAVEDAVHKINRQVEKYKDKHYGGRNYKRY